MISHKSFPIASGWMRKDQNDESRPNEQKFILKPNQRRKQGGRTKKNKTNTTWDVNECVNVMRYEELKRRRRRRKRKRICCWKWYKNRVMNFSCKTFFNIITLLIIYASLLFYSNIVVVLVHNSKLERRRKCQGNILHVHDRKLHPWIIFQILGLIEFFDDELFFCWYLIVLYFVYLDYLSTNYCWKWYFCLCL